MTIGNKLFGYAYDQIGNRQLASKNADIATYTANNLNQYSQINNGVVVTPKFDLDGNLTNDGRLAYTWDAENRLTSVLSNTTTIATYKYDYMSRRYQKVVNGVTNTFVYDGWNLISESGISTNYYVWGLDLSGSLQGAGGIGGLLSSTINNTNCYYFADGNGNITDVVSSNGSSLAHYEYDPYGNTIVKSGVLSEGNKFRFSSKYLDSESGLIYFGYRYYDPVTGRWLGSDPIEEEGGLNLYGFCGNDSVNGADVLGMWSDPVIEKGSGYGQSCSGKGDDASGLTQLLKTKYGIALDPTEYTKWLRDQSDQPVQNIEDGKTYRWPATVLITFGWLGTSATENIANGNMAGLINKYQTLGFKVNNAFVKRTQDYIFEGLGLTKGEIDKLIKNEKYLAVWVHASHGGKKTKKLWLLGTYDVFSGGTWITEGTYDTTTMTAKFVERVRGVSLKMEGGKEGLFAKDFSFPYKISEAYMYFCGAAKGDWKTLVASGGTLHADNDAVDYVTGGGPLRLTSIPVQ